MAELPVEIVLLVQEALLSGTTFAEFVENTRCFAVREDRAEALRAWLRKQGATGEGPSCFAGSEEELGRITECMGSECGWHVHGTALTASSVVGGGSLDYCWGHPERGV